MDPRQSKQSRAVAWNETAERTSRETDQWEFLQTRSVKWKWRQLGVTGTVVSESKEFAFLAHCMDDAERNGFCLDEHIISCDKGAALWSDPPELAV
jgi:hypothetical protein